MSDSKFILIILVNNISILMDLYENAWKNIVKPTQIKSKKYILGPSERMINGVKIVRVDM